MDLPPLSAADFPAFFQAIHLHPPFPWQERLLAEVLATGWTRPISVPTASGKTAVLDIAVFALACQAGLPATARTTPRRIALVVDRRIVVDGAFERATRIRDAILAKPELAAVRTRLLAWGGESPLDIALLRGGIYREDRWARSPAQPVILCSTVDQVGSRLLFRGYGLSNHTWSIHAGLLGNDTLIVLDEAHCSQPFLQTTEWIARYRQVATQPVLTPFAAVPMTATLAGGPEPFRLTDQDRAHPVLAARMNARKPITLAEPCGAKDDEVAAAAEQALVPQMDSGVTALAVVNRVAAARALYERLLQRTKLRKDPLEADLLLLIGRSRSVDRDALLNTYWDRLRSGRQRQDQARPLIVVATQCIEVGADLDADVLVTECCPLDALRQRLGRLDRLGQLHTETTRTAKATIICRKPYAWNGEGEPEEDAIYGEAMARTWAWLKAHETDLDGGIAALDARLPSAGDMTDLIAPPVDAPVIFPAYCDLWAQTGPAPAVSPEPSIFLHGPRQGEPEVQVVWRADLGEDHEIWADVVALCPPVTGETISLPLSAVRRWLAGDIGSLGTSDTDRPDGADLTEDRKKLDQLPPFAPALRWRGPDDSSVALDADALRPGDVLVVPCRYGGCDRFGWNPGRIVDAELTQDVADQARRAAHRAPVLRLHPSLVDRIPSPLTFAASLVLGDDPPEDWESAIRTALGDGFGTGPEILPHPTGQGVVIIATAGWSERAGDFTDEDDSSSRAPQPLPLGQHLTEVEAQARTYAQAVGLPQALIDDLALAGRLHDLGKADPRFQAWLQGGDALRARRAGLLAKSARLRTGAAMRHARERAGYPAGGRHELLSVRLAESADTVLAKAHDRDLVLHLVASHHGRCRPFAPVVVDERPVPVRWAFGGADLTASSATGLERLDSGIPERFWTLTRRYGWWGLAWLEACLRLADHRASEQAEQRKAP